MAPQPKKPTYKEALESGLQPLSKFFKPKRGRGKPKKKGNLASDKISVQEVKRGRGRPLTTKNVTTKNVPGRVRPLTTKNVTTKNVPAPKKEISSLLFVYYSIKMTPNGTGLKADFVKRLNQEIEKLGPPGSASRISREGSRPDDDSDLDAPATTGHVQGMQYNED
jgi:hypothetical protein